MIFVKSAVPGWRSGVLHTRALAMALLLGCLNSPLSAHAEPPPNQEAVATEARALGAQNVSVRALDDGGLLLNGDLEGHQFAVAIPADWNGEAVVYTHGYTLPAMPIAVADDPSAANGPSILQVAYGEGYAATHSAYDKPGMGVKSGVTNTLRLRDFLADLGMERIYGVGASMGGNILMAMIEQRPDAFDGAFAVCGVTDGWESELGPIFDMRAAYNVLTAGTPYALPGKSDVTMSALPMTPPADVAGSPGQFAQQQPLQLAVPILSLWQAAVNDPAGPEARIVRQVTAIGGYPEDVASLFYPFMVIGLGADDMRASFGGQIYGNRGKIYHPVEMTAAEIAAFNAAIQRFDADPAAQAEARRWHQVTGHFKTPLIAIHNPGDPLVPYSQAEGLTRHAQEAGSSGLLAQYRLPDMREPLPAGDIEGLSHCGFTQAQLSQGLGALRAWVNEGKIPSASAIR